MVKKSILDRAKKIEQLSKIYEKQRKELKLKIKASKLSAEARKSVMQNALKLDSLPKRSSKVKIRNRCFVTGRARGLNLYRLFGMCNFKIREKANNGEVLGLQKF